MFAEERLDKILEQLQKEGNVSVNELSDKFGLSKDAIRKDLQKLEKIGKLKRTYGGAILQREIAKNINMLNRINKNIEPKKKIVDKALLLINNGETIFLDISSTNMLLASAIAEKELKITVITNMLDIMNKLSNAAHLKLIGVGGVFNCALNGYIGAAAIEQIRMYRMDKAFIGTAGINIKEKSLSTFDIEDGITKKSIIEVSKEVVLLADRSKFDQDGNYKFATLDCLDYVVTNMKISSDVKDGIAGYGIQLIT